MAVSKETAAALAAKYPRLADLVPGAVALEVEEQHAVVNGKHVVVGRFQKFQIGRHVVSMEAPEPVVVVPVAPPVPVELTRAPEPVAHRISSEDETPVPHESPFHKEPRHDGRQKK